MRDFQTLEDQYNELMWLEDESLDKFKPRSLAKVAELQASATASFARMNKIASSDGVKNVETNEEWLRNYEEAVHALEELNKHYNGVRISL